MGKIKGVGRRTRKRRTIARKREAWSKRAVKRGIGGRRRRRRRTSGLEGSG